MFPRCLRVAPERNVMSTIIESIAYVDADGKKLTYACNKIHPEVNPHENISLYIPMNDCYFGWTN
tara:strand:+ start:4457 stop:4651 length:195 start_codon:yes stop_codon:yes gene_type:complete